MLNTRHIADREGMNIRTVHYWAKAVFPDRFRGRGRGKVPHFTDEEASVILDHGRRLRAKTIRHDAFPAIVVYFCYAADDTLLYVGSSNSLAYRISAHNRVTEWWPEVHHVTLEEHLTIQDARTAESALIQSLDPLYNVQLNSRRSKDRRQVLPPGGIRLPDGTWLRRAA